jgi:hypothetical protein
MFLYSFSYGEDRSVELYKELGLSDSLAQIEYQRYRKNLCYKVASKLDSVSQIKDLQGFTEEEKQVIEARYMILNPESRNPQARQHQNR